MTGKAGWWRGCNVAKRLKTPYQLEVKGEQESIWLCG
jgi:hypothetical protein